MFYRIIFICLAFTTFHMFMVITPIDPSLLKSEFLKLTNLLLVVINIILNYYINIACTAHFFEDEVYETNNDLYINVTNNDNKF